MEFKHLINSKATDWKQDAFVNVHLWCMFGRSNGSTPRGSPHSRHSSGPIGNGCGAEPPGPACSPCPLAHQLSFSPCCSESAALHSYKNGLSRPTSASNPFGDGDTHATTCEVTRAISAILLPQRLRISETLISGYRRDAETSAPISHPPLAFIVYLTACYLFRREILHGVYLRAKPSQCEKKP